MPDEQLRGHSGARDELTRHMRLAHAARRRAFLQERLANGVLGAQFQRALRTEQEVRTDIGAGVGDDARLAVQDRAGSAVLDPRRRARCRQASTFFWAKWHGLHPALLQHLFQGQVPIVTAVVAARTAQEAGAHQHRLGSLRLAVRGVHGHRPG